MEQIEFFNATRKRSDLVLMQGKNSKQIAFLLGVSERTIEFHLKYIYTKLQMNSKIELILLLGKSTGILSRNLEKNHS